MTHVERLHRDYWHQLKAGRAVRAHHFSVPDDPDVVDILLEATGYNDRIVGTGIYRAVRSVQDGAVSYLIQPEEVLRIWLR